jgi:hypothetical protein
MLELVFQLRVMEVHRLLVLFLPQEVEVEPWRVTVALADQVVAVAMVVIMLAQELQDRVIQAAAGLQIHLYTEAAVEAELVEEDNRVYLQRQVQVAQVLLQQ